jgi:hypothetical protein
MAWAYSVPVSSPAERLVLVTYAWRAGAKLRAWPGLDRLLTDTRLHRETISKARRALEHRGYLRDTGERRHYAAVYELGLSSEHLPERPHIQPEGNAEKPANPHGVAAIKCGNPDEDMSGKPRTTPLSDSEQSMNSSSAQAREPAQRGEASRTEQAKRVEGFASPIDLPRRAYPELAAILPPAAK